MKIRFFAIILSTLLCLSACGGSKSSSGGVHPPDVVRISAESKVTEAKIGEPFEIQVGLGRTENEVFETARFQIDAANFAIILPDGSRVEEEYVLEIPDYLDEKYIAPNDKINFFETYRLIFIGEGDCEGNIYFTFTGLTLGGSELRRVWFYYTVKGETIRLTKENPEKAS